MTSGANAADYGTFFGDAFQRGYSITLRFLMARGANAETAAEISQAAWARGWTCRHQLHNQEALGTWVNSIAQNMLRGWYRWQGRWRQLTETMAPSIDAAPTQDLPAIFGQCSRQDVLLLTDYYLNGFTTAEIAARSGLCPATVRVRLHRCRGRLRRRLLATPRARST